MKEINTTELSNHVRWKDFRDSNLTMHWETNGGSYEYIGGYIVGIIDDERDNG